MKFLSAKGEKSTAFERAFFIGILLIATGLIAPGIRETVQTKSLLAAAEPAVLEKCQSSSGYSQWRFWDSRIQAYSTCIVEAKDPKVQNAAGKYLLQGKEGKLTVETKPTEQMVPSIKAP